MAGMAGTCWVLGHLGAACATAILQKNSRRGQSDALVSLTPNSPGRLGLQHSSRCTPRRQGSRRCGRMLAGAAQSQPRTCQTSASSKVAPHAMGMGYITLSPLSPTMPCRHSRCTHQGRRVRTARAGQVSIMSRSAPLREAGRLMVACNLVLLHLLSQPAAQPGKPLCTTRPASHTLPCSLPLTCHLKLDTPRPGMAAASEDSICAFMLARDMLFSSASTR